MSLFSDSEQALADLKGLDDKLEAPDERLGSPAAARAIYDTLALADGDSSFNRGLVQGQMNFLPPHDEKELENKGQSDRFNITTGEGPAIKNEAVAAYMDIYTTPRMLVDIPLDPSIDKNYATTWGQVMAEEFTTMDRSDDSSLPTHLLLADTYVTHGVAVGYFDDPETMQFSVAGLDHFKFPRKTGIVSSKAELVTALGEYSASQLYRKIGNKGWDTEAIKKAIRSTAGRKRQDWDNWELIQREIKSNELFVDSICEPIEVIFTWVQEFDGGLSYYISARSGLDAKGHKDEQETFLFKSRNHYKSADQCFQIFPFSVGDGGRLYTVRGLGYLIYQLCNAMDIMHCKLLDNARVGSSLLVQPATTEDAQDMQLIDFGGGIALPPTMRIPEQRVAQNLNNSLIPAINESRQILNRATGGLASGQMMLQPEQDRRTKLEVSSQLDYMNKLNSFAINLFYGPYDKIMREKVRRAFTVPQKDREAAKRVEEMKQRCLDRGVPPEAFTSIDLKAVRASRIIGTGSRASRIMLMDQMQQMYSTWDAVGRSNFEFDYLVELVGPEKAERYAGQPNLKRETYDDSIATLENFQLLEGDYMEPKEGQDQMVHLPKHIDELEVGLKEVDEGQIDLMQWTMEHEPLYRHCVATLEITVVHETVQPELNMYHQRVQQIGELVVNGMKMINKAQKEGKLDPQPGQEGQDPEQAKVEQEMRASDLKHKQEMQQNWQKHMAKLDEIKAVGQQKMVIEAQKAMGKVAERDVEVQERMNRLRASQI